MKKNHLSLLPLVAATALWMLPKAASAAVVSLGVTPNAIIPDGNASGLVSTIVSAERGFVTALSVNLEIVGGWNGDLYVYLEHEGAISVLMNRIGRTASSLVGAASSGVTVSFTDAATVDIHVAPFPSFGIAVGTFQPDARFIDPLLTTDASPRTNFLSNFNDLPVAGQWTLFVADVASGDTAVLKSWSIQATTIPEPSSLLCLSLAALCAARRQRPFTPAPAWLHAVRGGS